MEAGVQIEDYFTKPCKIKMLGNTSFMITLTEGKKHQIRRMVSALHNEVVDLKRIRVMNVELGNVKANQYRAIVGEELKTFLTKLGL
jgi:23S rRNA pseudouridine2604 synthase